MLSMSINWLAVLAGVVAMQVIGTIWYSPVLFAKPWMKSIGKTPEDLGSPAKGIVIGIILAVLTCIAMAYIVGWSGAETVVDAIIVGAIVGIGLCAAVIGTNSGYDGRPLSYVLINSGHYLADMIAVSLILTLWQ